MSDQDKLMSIEVRIDYIEKNMEKRLDTLNHYRELLAAKNNEHITRIEFDAKHLLTENKIDFLQKMVYIGIGGVMVLEVLLRFIK